MTKPIPYSKITTLFLDAGNTIISMDFDWIAGELRKHGIATTVSALRRAEAGARPIVSKQLGELKSTEMANFFVVYLSAVLSRLPKAATRNTHDVATLAGELAPVFKDAKTRRLWCKLMPRVPQALRRLHDAGLRMVVVSNADGTVESLFRDLGLRDLFAHVVDSGVIGFEKPDPRIFQHALKLSGSRPEETLHVGDIYHVDVLGARAAGIHALLLDPFDDWPGDIDCERLPDLLALAGRLTGAGKRG